MESNAPAASAQRVPLLQTTQSTREVTATERSHYRESCLLYSGPLHYLTNCHSLRVELPRAPQHCPAQPLALTHIQDGIRKKPVQIRNDRQRRFAQSALPQ